MNEPTSERLYNLLPAVYRIRDAEHAEPLRALLGVIEEELRALEQDISGLYDDWFIETCAEWVIPYIGDLLGVHGVHPLSARAGNLRSYVANTLAYRRRKGTAAVLEQVARDVTGWTAHAVEFFQLLATTQHLNHLRPHNLRTPNLRDTNRLELLDGPFETAAHTADVRRIATRGGKYNIPNVGVFLWRLQSYPLTRVTAREITAREIAGKCYTFDPTGRDIHLFNRPQTETQITHLSEEVNVPTPLRRRPLYDELEAHRQALVSGQKPRNVYFDDRQPVLQVFINGQKDPAPPKEILICHLGDWRRPPQKRQYTHIQSDGTKIEQPPPIQLAVDPVLGRLTFPDGVVPNHVEVSYAYGFSGDVGAGPYNRTAFARQVLNRAVDWQVGVSQEQAGGEKISAVGDEQIFRTLAEAVAEWNNQPPGKVGVIAIMDSRTYNENLTGNEHTIKIPEGSQLLIIAADWSMIEDANAPKPCFRLLKLPSGKVRVGPLAATGRRPHLQGSLDVLGTAGTNSLSAGELVIDGLLIEGKLTVRDGNLGSLQVVHCTLISAKGDIKVLSTDADGKRNDALKLTVRQTICRRIVLPDTVPSLCVTESIIDQPGGTALKAKGAAVEIERSTVLGGNRVRRLEASNSIFTEAVTVEQRQAGCVRFCVLPYDSRTPQRFRCQPDLALAERAAQRRLSSVADLPESERRAVRDRLKPVFTSLRYGDPAYAQLSLACAEEIRTGAEDGSEMGVFSALQQPQREANLRAALEEYLRFGLEAGIFYVT